MVTIKKYDLFSIPEGYIKVEPSIELKDNRSMTMTSTGLVKINNNLYYDSTRKSYSKINIFFSEKRNRYFISSVYRKAFILSDIESMTKKFKDITAKDAIGILGLDPKEFKFDKSGGIEKIVDDKQSIFFTVKKIKRNWECLNYVIIG
jgi:hypothetical protein